MMTIGWGGGAGGGGKKMVRTGAESLLQAALSKVVRAV